MHLPAALNSVVTTAQINHPVIAARIVRALTGSSHSAGSDAPRPAEAQRPAQPARVNGIEAAKLAAGVPETT